LGRARRGPPVQHPQPLPARPALRVRWSEAPARECGVGVCLLPVRWEHLRSAVPVPAAHTARRLGPRPPCLAVCGRASGWDPGPCARPWRRRQRQPPRPLACMWQCSQRRAAALRRCTHPGAQRLAGHGMLGAAWCSAGCGWLCCRHLDSGQFRALGPRPWLQGPSHGGQRPASSAPCLHTPHPRSTRARGHEHMRTPRICAPGLRCPAGTSGTLRSSSTSASAWRDARASRRAAGCCCCCR
jgi:hypothetical protein